MKDRDRWNGARFEPGMTGGHYESWFQRANHPTQRQGFWIRYTIFCPRGAPERAVGELWAIWFDGTRGRVTAVKSVVPLWSCSFSASGLDARIGAARLDDRGLVGAVEDRGHRLSWDLRYASDEAPLLLLPERFYRGGFPKAKAVVGAPLAVFDGRLEVDGEVIEIDGWVGSQNHNWGSRHTDAYAWGQVAGFDDAPDAFLECSTARVRMGPVWTPWMTLVVLRLDGQTHSLNALPLAVRAKGAYDFFTWSFETATREVEIRGTISAARADFVGLPYDNPPGGQKTCLNTKIARCDLVVRRRGRPPRSLACRHRAAFEILTDATDHDVGVIAVPDLDSGAAGAKQ